MIIQAKLSENFHIFYFSNKIYNCIKFINKMTSKSNIENVIALLPQDIKTKIFFEYFETKVLYEELIELVRSEECCNLYHQNLAKILPCVFRNELLMKYLNERESEFSQVLKKNTQLVPKQNEYNKEYFENFACLWLYNLYFTKLFSGKSGDKKNEKNVLFSISLPKHLLL
jgi:hypothetical protein